MMTKSVPASVSPEGSQVPGDDAENPHSPWEPLRISPGDFNLRYLIMMSKTPSPSGSPGVFRLMMLNLVVGDAGPHKHVTPHPMRIGEFYHILCPVNPFHALWEWVLLLLYSWNSGLWAVHKGFKQRPRGDIKLFMGGPVWRPSPPVGWDHLANVGQEAPCRFSGYRLGSLLQC